mmetsp:Transcript_117296/g.378550  ORF Transcript_117296/g.378550 Transcript_117296/m.378550 type:complete len:156 (+) Transcript_117296:281-748(+)
MGSEYNTTYSWRGMTSCALDSLRLVLWAQSQGRNEEFMEALGWRHFAQDALLADHKVLTEAAEEAGLSRESAAKVLQSGAFAEELEKGIQEYAPYTRCKVPATDGDDGELAVAALPTFVFRTTSPRHKGQLELLQGSRPQEEFEKLLMRLEAIER